MNPVKVSKPLFWIAGERHTSDKPPCEFEACQDHGTFPQISKYRPRETYRLVVPNGYNDGLCVHGKRIQQLDLYVKRKFISLGQHAFRTQCRFLGWLADHFGITLSRVSSVICGPFQSRRSNSQVAHPMLMFSSRRVP
jgi:hypothetical protein